MSKTIILTMLVLAFIAGVITTVFVNAVVSSDISVPNSQQPAIPASLIDKPSPSDWVSEKDIQVFKDRVTLNVPNVVWAKFTNTKSMDPVLDSSANALELVPTSDSQIHVGDIIAYKADWIEGTVIHRIIKTGSDENGWYAIVKGDNNPVEDPGKVRFDQVKRVVIAIIY